MDHGMHHDTALFEQDHIHTDELRVGLTRPATVAGVPLKPLLLGMGAVGMAFMASGHLATLLLALPLFGILRLVSAANPRIFAELAAWSRVHARCRNRRYWGAPSFAPRATRRWETT